MTTHSPVLLDTSAVLALLFDEPGAERVDQAIGGNCTMTAANWAELGIKLKQLKSDWEWMLEGIRALGVQVEPTTADDAELAARMSEKRDGLSLGDRLCLAAAQRLDITVLTADTQWEGLPHVSLIR